MTAPSPPAGTLPSPPFIDVPGISNFRVLTGNGIRPGLVYRSADPTRATPEGLQQMSKDLGKVRVSYHEHTHLQTFLPDVQRMQE